MNETQRFLAKRWVLQKIETALKSLGLNSALKGNTRFKLKNLDDIRVFLFGLLDHEKLPDPEAKMICSLFDRIQILEQDIERLNTLLIKDKHYSIMSELPQTLVSEVYTEPLEAL